jgi:tetratricopeptide (TPR) repeat protein
VSHREPSLSKPVARESPLTPNEKKPKQYNLLVFLHPLDAGWCYFDCWNIKHLILLLLCLSFTDGNENLLFVIIMYANRVTPIQRMRNHGPRQSATQGVGPAPKRRSVNVGCSTQPPKLTGDYQVLKMNAEKERYSVRQARVALANSLDQLGEHHVRQNEYDDAMDAFTEALREKRGVYSQIDPSTSTDHGHSMRSRTSSFSYGGGDSLLSGVGGGGGGGVAATTEPPEVQHDRAIDEIVNTLRNMGNVHSLRGEQDEAMRYFTEVTSLRAQKSSNISVDPSTVVDGEARSILSGFNDDTSTLMSEINEDVKALDDLFRSISFRNGQQGAMGASDKASVASSTEKRKSKQTCKHDSRSTSKRRKSNAGSVGSSTKKTKDSSSSGGIVENEPFSRSASPSNLLPVSGNEVSEAIEMYKSILEDSYVGPRQVQHQEMLNSLSLRAELLRETRRQSAAAGSDPSSESPPPSTKASDLELALEIYNQVLVAHEETSHAKRQQHQEQQQQTVPTTGTTPLSSPPMTDEEVLGTQQSASLVASTLICMGSIYYKLGNRVEELQMYRQAKGVYQEAFGEQHVFVAGTRKNIGMVLAERGEYDEAMKQFHKAMRIYLAINEGSDMNRDVASAISCMGNVKNRVGELDAALEQYMEALRIYKSLYQFQHDETSHSPKAARTPLLENEVDALRDVTSTLKVIGMVHAKKGDLDMAMHFFQDAMKLLRTPEIEMTTTGRETLASVLTRIASIHLKKTDLEQAMSNYREAYDLTVKNRGTTNHPEVAGILHYIGGIYHKRADYDEAMACYQEAIRIYHATYGPGNPTVAGTLVMVGSIYYKRRNLDSAMMFYREALRLNRDAYGMHFPDVAPILKSIGTILTKKGEYKEAYDIFRDVLSIKCTVHGLDHPEVASAYKSLGNVHYKLGELADAERQYRHALSIYRKTKGEDHADTISAKTTIEHLRYWMREREQRQEEQRHSKNTPRTGERSSRNGAGDDERSC